MHVTCIHSSHPIFLFPVICFELPLTRTFFDFPRRFELSGVDCTSFVFSMSIAFSITPRFNQGEPDDGQKHGPRFEGFNNYRQHKDPFYYILYSSLYCLLQLQIAKDAFRIVLWLLQRFTDGALRFSSFRFKTVICLLLRCTMLYATERRCLCTVN